MAVYPDLLPQPVDDARSDGNLRYRRRHCRRSRQTMLLGREQPVLAVDAAARRLPLVDVDDRQPTDGGRPSTIHLGRASGRASFC